MSLAADKRDCFQPRGADCVCHACKVTRFSLRGGGAAEKWLCQSLFATLHALSFWRGVPCCQLPCTFATQVRFEQPSSSTDAIMAIFTLLFFIQDSSGAASRNTISKTSLPETACLTGRLQPSAKMQGYSLRVLMAGLSTWWQEQDCGRGQRQHTDPGEVQNKSDELEASTQCVPFREVTKCNNLYWPLDV